MSKMKKCPFCAEEIKFEAIKCRFCGSNLKSKEKILEESILDLALDENGDALLKEKKNNNFFKKYITWLTINYSSENVVEKDLDDLKLILTRKYRSFNWLICLLLLLLWVLPGLIYILVTYREKDIKTIISFNEDGKVIDVSNGYKYLMNNYNKTNFK